MIINSIEQKYKYKTIALSVMVVILMMAKSSAFANCTVNGQDYRTIYDTSGTYITLDKLTDRAVSWNNSTDLVTTCDVSQFTSMYEAFKNNSTFNQDIGDWNTSNVTNMGQVFRGASTFNQDISDWNTSNVTNMGQVFRGASTFNQDISDWNTSNVTNMGQVFSGASTFNQDISDWNTSNVTNMNNMFNGASTFNQDIRSWNVSSLNSSNNMFYNANEMISNFGSTTDWNITPTKEWFMPSLSSSTPANDATGVEVDANIVLNFSEAVDVESGNIVIYKASDNSAVETIAVGSGQVTGSGTTQITIDPNGDLASSTQYYVQIAATGFDDTAGNSYAGITNTTSLSFTTADIVAPILSSSSPADDTTAVAVDSNIVLNFSEAVDVESGNIVIYKASDNSAVETIAVGSGQVTGSGTTQITIDPNGDLASSTQYYVQIAATGFDDTAGNSYAGITNTTSLSFTTADIVAPILSSSSPADDTTAVAVDSNIVLNFSEAVDVESGNIVIYKASDNSAVETIAVGSGQVTGSGTTQITIDPNGDLASSTQYYVQIAATGFDDTAGNSYAGITNTTSLSFTTADIVAPILSSSSPADDTTAVAVDSNIVLNFSEAVDVESGNIVIYKASDNSAVETIAVGSGQVTGSGTTQITIDPNGDLASSTQYYVQIAATGFDDTAGNSYAGITNTTSLSFTTADIVAPILSSSSPADDTTAVAVDSNIVLNFSEAVDVESGNIVIYKASDNSAVETIAVGSGQVTGSGTTQITIDPNGDLASSTQYYVQIAATGFDDTAGNSYAGITNTTSLSFTTADIVAPILSSSSPADDTTAVAVDKR